VADSIVRMEPGPLPDSLFRLVQERGWKCAPRHPLPICRIIVGSHSISTADRRAPLPHHFVIPAVLFLEGALIDMTLPTDAPYGFIGCMLLFGELVYGYAMTVCIPWKRSVIWAAVVLFGLIVGAFFYAREHRQLTRAIA